MSQSFKSDAEFASWNERMFKKYHNERVFHHPNPAIRWVEHERRRKLLRLADIRPSDKVLEVGCGEGCILEKVRVGELHGIDVSETAIARAREKLKDNDNVRSLQVGWAEHLPFDDASFDVVLCSEVIEHVREPRDILREMLRVLKPDGRLSISFPNEHLINTMKQLVGATGLFSIILPNVPRKMDDEWHLSTFSLSLFHRKIAGLFRIEHLQAAPLFIFPLRYVALCRKA